MGYSLVLLAAGQGKRMQAGRNKLFIELKGKPLITYTLKAFEEDEWCEEIIIVAHQDEIDILKQIVRDFHYEKVKVILVGGAERQDSVRVGIAAIDMEKIVLIHDGARPFVKKAYVHQLIAKTEEVGAAILAVPTKETIKEVHQQRVSKTLERRLLWNVQTPQAFQLPIIQEAHQQALQEGRIGTDDASLVEWVKHPVAIVEGDYYNIKITTPEDLLFAEAILEREVRE
ncbi:2-C-methyl-D-erythritol 4-phosphate cytidylyltransferase [Alkalihalobacillus pseudalcaliphilus]|uniref:2-C-methyl-D-erythritol 4-phosphate cytidylyltransferase n=1 Tax=Alkalihalobacillus pseudalcaliphilus TaxID=79884 RepID=UPI00064DD6F3|nr:2-C-methyl-D-erythritol 4-phosphate cytidylyltransferase [Alkalihalobacillus pseudalcaliphilus]KMK74844.1 2-C-methyl-D-erythritol 4-phosphate cytidylyltransferase [Alkalihalobacillus pseudalcaliphilus]